MKKTGFFFIPMLVLVACSNNTSNDTGKIKLVFQPVKEEFVTIDYDFTVKQIASGDITSFGMILEGKGATAEDGKVTLEMTNSSIKMKGNIQGKDIKASANGPDFASGDARLVSMPVFSLIGKTYRSVYNGQLDKKSEVQLKNNELVDSSENKMQFFLRYPSNEIRVGDSWQKEIVVKAGNKMNCSAKYILKEIKGDTAIVEMTGKLYGKGESFGNEFSIDGKVNATFSADVKTGWPLRSEINQEFTLKIGGKDIPMNYSIRSEVTRSTIARQ